MLNLNQFQIAARDAYVVAALWSSTDDTGEPIDANYDANDIDPHTLDTMRIECDQFISGYWSLIVQTAMTPEQCGHDFWLTRNHHGTGFWDRGYPDALGDALTEAAHCESQRDLYIGDDGKIYQA